MTNTADNIPLWQAITHRLNAGDRPIDIATELDCHRQYVYTVAKRNRDGYVWGVGTNHSPGGWRRRDRKQHQRSCIECGAHLTTKPQYPNVRCHDCDAQRQRRIRDGLRAHRALVLKIAAARAGRVPTITECAHVLGVGRARAGEFVIEAFGRDHRVGGQRNRARTFPVSRHRAARRPTVRAESKSA